MNNPAAAAATKAIRVPAAPDKTVNKQPLCAYLTTLAAHGVRVVNVHASKANITVSAPNTYWPWLEDQLLTGTLAGGPYYCYDVDDDEREGP